MSTAISQNIPLPSYPEPLTAPTRQPFFSMAELAARWRCSRGTVYNRLRQVGAKVLDFSTKGRKSKKAVPAVVVMQIEAQHTRRLA